MLSIKSIINDNRFGFFVQILTLSLKFFSILNLYPIFISFIKIIIENLIVEIIVLLKNYYVTILFYNIYIYIYSDDLLIVKLESKLFSNPSEDQESISPTFCEQPFCKNILCSAFLYLHLRFLFLGTRILAQKLLLKCCWK